jgi:hypothetical protein
LGGGGGEEVYYNISFSAVWRYNKYVAAGIFRGKVTIFKISYHFNNINLPVY